MEITDAYELLYRLGLTANRTGFFHTACAVSLAAEQPERLLLVTKWLYPEVAKHYGTTPVCVERNLRSARDVVWETAPTRLEELARHPLVRRPTASQFLAILASSFPPRSSQQTLGHP